MADRNPKEQELTEEDITTALQKSGYPLELEVRADLMAAGLSPSLGTRLSIGGGKFKEIDVVGSCVVGGGTVDALDITVSLELRLHVKRLQGPSAFVGILGEPLTASQGWAARFYVGGIPSSRDLDHVPEVAQLFYGPKGLTGAMDPFRSLPVCAHWATVTRRKDDAWNPWATGNDNIAEDLSTLVCTRNESVASFSAFCALNNLHPVLIQYQLGLVIDSPGFFLYDAMQKKLTAVEMFTVHKAFDTVEGPRWAMIDMVTPAAVPKYSALCMEAGTRLGNAALERGRELIDLLPKVRGLSTRRSAPMTAG